MATYGDMLDNLKKNFTDIAKEVSSGEFGKKIYPGQQELAQELNNTIAGNLKLSKSLLDDKVQTSVRGTLEAMGLSDIDSMVHKIHASTYEKDIDGLADTLAKYSDKSGIAINMMKSEAKDIVNNGMQTGNLNLNFFDKAKKYPLAYFSNPDKNIRNTRIATAAGLYAGLAVGGRYLSGGTLTNDSYGRKDIAGIPFI